MHNAQELQAALDNAVTTIANIGRKARANEQPTVAGLAFTASELLREILAEVDGLVAFEEAGKVVPFDKPKEKKPGKPRAAKASADAPKEKQATIPGANGNGAQAPAGAE